MLRTLSLSLCLAVSALALPPAQADVAPPGDDPQIAQAFDADQRERAELPRQASQDALRSFARQLALHDAERRAAVQAALHEQRLRTAADYRKAATIMQHGQAPADYALAHALATIGSTLAPDDRELRWLAAAATDRWLLSRKQLQWYGTQPVCDARATPPTCRLDVAETAVSDEERAAAGIAPLEELRREADARAKKLGTQLGASKSP